MNVPLKTLQKITFGLSALTALNACGENQLVQNDTVKVDSIQTETTENIICIMPPPTDSIQKGEKNYITAEETAPDGSSSATEYCTITDTFNYSMDLCEACGRG